MTDTVRDTAAFTRPTLEGLEERWSQRWQEEGTYAFDRSKDRADVYSIDTPPPTVSGDLHIGHVFSYTHTDLIARYQRMRGKAVFYPVGWDDNGLPTERRVQLRFGVRCDPSLPYDPDFAPPATPDRRSQQAISRRNFVELCERATLEDEERYEALWRRLGLSVDWSHQYTTIGATARATAQRAFLRNLARGEAYTALAPSLWDATFQTAVAQAELEDREQPGAYHRLSFTGPDGAALDVDTTRPELLPACVALVCHPDDPRYAHLVGQTATTPLFAAVVAVHAHPLADPEVGTGLVMVCTFGDLTDVTWWRDLRLPTRAVLGRDGRLLADAPSGVDATAYAEVAGRTTRQARTLIVDRLREQGRLVGEPRPITHWVRFYEKGDAPLEIVTTRQWYIRNGGRDEPLRADLLAQGSRLQWVPEHMRHRYEHWVNGLTGDWLISRQRFFGVPFPVWYPLDAEGEPRYSDPLTPAETALPIDPSSDVPDGYTEAQRGQPGGFAGDPDVMDTWATSSLSPQIVGGWERDPDLYGRVFPMDLRPQAHEIIRTWLFATVLRSWTEERVLPWRTAVLSGWIIDPERRKLSKSRGLNFDPTELIDRHGADAVRYWAACGRPGVDTAFDEKQMKIGRRLATKLLNASAFALNLGTGDAAGAITEPLDASLLARLSTVVDTATRCLDSYDHTGALTATESLFWAFCDDYIELVKQRAYGDGAGAASAQATLRLAVDVQLRLFAPFLPYVTEEIWSWWRSGSVHTAPWPTTAELAGADPSLLDSVAAALRQVRRAKSEAKVSMRAEVRVATVRAPGPALAALRSAESDLRAAGRIDTLNLVDQSGELTVECEL